MTSDFFPSNTTRVRNDSSAISRRRFRMSRS
jgi:hypothetical protein